MASQASPDASMTDRTGVSKPVLSTRARTLTAHKSEVARTGFCDPIAKEHANNLQNARKHVAGTLFDGRFVGNSYNPAYALQFLQAWDIMHWSHETVGCGKPYGSVAVPPAMCIVVCIQASYGIFVCQVKR